MPYVTERSRTGTKNTRMTVRDGSPIHARICIWNLRECGRMLAEIQLYGNHTPTMLRPANHFGCQRAAFRLGASGEHVSTVGLHGISVSIPPNCRFCRDGI